MTRIKRGPSQVGLMAMQPGVDMPLRPSVAVWQLTEPSINWRRKWVKHLRIVHTDEFLNL